MIKPTHLALLLASILAAPQRASAQTFRVVTSNLWYSGTRGFNYLTQDYPLGRNITWSGIKTYMRNHPAAGYCVIATQEIDRGTRRTGALDAPAGLNAFLGSGWNYRFSPTQNSDGGQTGNATFTNASIVKEQHWKFAFNAASPTDFGPRPRGAVALKLDFNGKRLWFVNTHLEPSNRFALAQVFQLLGNIKTFDPDTPVLVVGDLNILNGTGGSATEKTFYKMNAAFTAAGFSDVSEKKSTRLLGATSGSAVTDGQLDYIYLYDPHARLRVAWCYAGYVMSYPYVFTDHRAVVAKFEWN